MMPKVPLPKVPFGPLQASAISWLEFYKGPVASHNKIRMQTIQDYMKGS